MVLFVTSYVPGRKRKGREISTISNNILSTIQYSLSGFKYHIYMHLFLKASRPALGPPTHLFQVIGACSPAVSSWVVKPATRLQPVPRWRVSGVMPSFPHVPPLSYTGTALPCKCNLYVRRTILFSVFYISVGKKNIYKGSILGSLLSNLQEQFAFNLLPFSAFPRNLYHKLSNLSYLGTSSPIHCWKYPCSVSTPVV
jgi:hypothetical protein